MEEENSAGLDRSAEICALRKKIAAMPLKVLIAIAVLFGCWVTTLCVDFKFGIGITFLLSCIWAMITLIDYKLNND
jgi:F0F1-type ATP synthase assembly protein I